MDPFTILPYELQEEICSYLKFPDIIESSFVCKSWYQVIGESKSCMNRIFFRNPLQGLLEQIDYILKSRRHYQHVILFEFDENVKKDTKILRNMKSIINKFSESLTNLSISHDLQRTSELPKLRELDFFGSLSHRLIVANGLITKANNLINFDIESCCLGNSSIEYLVNSLKDNSSLKDLKINDCRVMNALNTVEVKFVLEEFHVHQTNSFERNSNISNFINKFKPSLKTICGPLTFQEIANLMTDFPKLLMLSVRNELLSFLSPGQEFLEMQINETIKVLSIDPAFGDLMDDRFYTNFNAIISKLGNVQLLLITFINTRILDIILVCRSLKYIKYFHLEDMSIIQLLRIGVDSHKIFIPIIPFWLDEP
ncbi:hypothetical protein ACKWTF_001429 [Chironomus riparius]